MKRIASVSLVLIFTLALLPGMVQAYVIIISDKELLKGAIQVLDCKDREIGSINCYPNNGHKELNQETYHDQIPIPGTTAAPATELYNRIASSGQIAGWPSGDILEKFFNLKKTDVVRQKKGTAGTVFLSQYTPANSNIGTVDPLEPYEVLKVRKDSDKVTDVWGFTWKFKGEWQPVNPEITCVGSITDKFRFDSQAQGAACIQGQRVPTLTGGYEAIAIPDDAVGKRFTDIIGNCPIDLAFGNYRPERTPTATEDRFTRLHWQDDSRTVSSNMIGFAMFVRTPDDLDSCRMNTAGTVATLGVQAANLKQGVNFISITDSMLGKSFEELGASCNFEKIGFLMPKFCNAAKFKSTSLADEVCIESFARISPQTRLNDLYRGKGFVVQVSSACELVDVTDRQCTNLGQSIDNNHFCSFSGNVLQKKLAENCNNNFECKSNICFDTLGRCLTPQEKQQRLSSLS